MSVPTRLVSVSHLHQVVELDLGTVEPCCSGPKRPQDRVPVSHMKEDFESCLGAKVGTDPPVGGGGVGCSGRSSEGHVPLLPQQGFKGFQVAAERHTTAVPFRFDGADYLLGHGSVVIAAITSCTNTSNPSVMLGAGGWR